MSTESKFGGVFDRGEIGFDPGKMSWAHWLAAVLAIATGGIHVYLYMNQGFVPFLFAGVVFFGAVIGLLFNVYRRLLYALGVPFTAGQIVMWAAQGMPDMGIAMYDKPIQVLLILVLLFLFVREDELAGGS